MKKSIILSAALAALLPLALFAQSSPSAPSQPSPQAIPPAPAPPVAAPGRHLHEHEMGRKEAVTFLGVESSSVPRVLSEQMNLPRGFGVVVDYVVPESAAAAAGLQRSDIIRMLNDQIIVNPSQLGALVRNFSEGTTVTLTVLRKGQEMKLPVKLTKHDISVGHSLGESGDWNWNFDKGDFGKMNLDFKAPDMSVMRNAVQAAVEQAQNQAARAGDEARRAADRLRIITRERGTTKSTRVDLGNATITFSDDQGELKLKAVDGKKVLFARDAQGKLLFQGPVDTEEERAKIPAEVRKRFEKLENQELPEVPEAPEPPDAPEPPTGNESVHLQSPGTERAALSPNNRTGWRRSTVLL